jgi:serine protease Do
MCGLYPAAAADTLQLKEGAAITGKVLAEKKDSIAIDVGYTVLVVPKEQISGLSRAVGAMVPIEGNPPDPLESVVPQPLVASAAPARVSDAGALYSTTLNVAGSGTVRDLVSVIGEAVVQVRTPASIGSGFVINEEGFLITNFHVIEGESQISIEVYHLQDGQLEPRSYKQVRIVAMNKFADLALLKIDDKGTPKFKFVPLGRADDVGVGERVFAIGSPLGLERTVTEGIVSTKTRQMAGELYLQTSAQINPGNSGGPLLNLRGEVVGVTNMKITFGEGLGFAIPVEAVKFFLDHRDAFAYSNDNPSNAYRYLEPPSRTRHFPSSPVPP